MRTRNLPTMMFVLCACTACNDDENEETPLNQVIAGRYDGYTKAIAQYFPVGQYTDKQSITLITNEDGTVNVTYTPDSFGKFTINNATIKSESDICTFSGREGTVMAMVRKGPKTYNCTLKGIIDATRAAPPFKISVPVVMDGLAIAFIQGEAPVVAAVANFYAGYTKAIAQYFPNGEYTADQMVRMTVNKDGTVNVTYTFGFFDEFTINNAIVKSESNVYTLSGEGRIVAAMAGKGPKTYDCALGGTINVAKAVPSSEIFVPAVVGGLIITFAKDDASTNKQAKNKVDLITEQSHLHENTFPINELYFAGNDTRIVLSL